MLRIKCIALSLVLSACAASPPFDPNGIDRDNEVSESVKRRIASLEAGTIDREEAKRIVKVSYQGKSAYLLTAPCCDQFNYLYDAEGKRLCAPSGGITGHGDGRCTEAVEVKEAKVTNQKPER